MNKVNPGSGKLRVIFLFTVILLVLIPLTSACGKDSPKTNANKTDKPIVSIELTQVEQALANDSIVVLAHANISALAKLEDRFLGTGDENPLKSIEEKKGFITELEKIGLDLRTDISDALFSLHIDDKEKANKAAVLLGNFSTAKIIKYLEDSHGATKWKSGNGDVYEFDIEDSDTCKKEHKVVHISDSLILAGEEREFVGTVLGWLKSTGKGVNSTDKLNKWTTYRGGKLLSVAVFAPDKAHNTSSGMGAMMLSGASKKLEAVQSMYVGASVSPLGDGIVLELLLNSNDKEWITTSATKWQEKVAKNRVKVVEKVKTAAPLYDALKITPESEHLKLNITLDEKAKDTIGDIAKELVSGMFGGGGRRVAGAAPDDQLDDNPKMFLANYSTKDFKAYDMDLYGSTKSVWTDGPFGITLEKLGLDDKNQIEIEFSATGQSIENFGKTPGATITVSTVTSRNGAELMRLDSCGKDKSQDPVRFVSVEDQTYKDGKSITYQNLRATKKVGLVKGASLVDIKEIKGKISLRLPIKTESVIIPAPVSNHAVNKYGARVFIKMAEKGKISFEQSGDVDAILAVRALNKDKKYLYGVGSFSSSGFFSSGTKNIVRSYRGDTKFVEIVFAKKLEDISYDFVLNDLMPDFSEKDWVKNLPDPEPGSKEAFNKEFSTVKTTLVEKHSSWEDLPLATSVKGPINLLLKEVRTGYMVFGKNNFSSEFEIQGPVVPALTDNLSGVEVLVNKIEYTDGTKNELNSSLFFSLGENTRDSYVNGGVVKNKDLKYIVGNSKLELNLAELDKYSKKDLQLIVGTLALRLPKKFQTARFDALSLGKNSEAGPFVAIVSSLSKGKLSINGTGPVEKIVRIQVLNKNGDSIGRAESIISNDNIWTTSVEFQGTPVNVEITYATKQDLIKYPYTLKLAKKESE